MKGTVIAAIILVAFVGAAFAATLTATPNQVGMGEFVIKEGSGFEANVAVTTATIYDAVPQFKTGRINNNVAFGPSRSKFFSPETNNGAVSYGVNLTVDDETKTTDIGVNATYILTVTNTGNATDSFNLTYTNPDIASVVTLNKTQVTLVQSATETVSLNITNATVGIGTFRVNVTATSQNESNKTDYINTTTTIAIYGVTLTVDNETKTTDVGENATYILTVKNTGNVNDTFNLTCTNQDNASVVGLNKTQVTLIPLATETVSLNVTNATVGIGAFRVNVTASSLNGPNKTDYINTTTTIAIYGVNLTVDNETKTTDVGENATYILTVTNIGNADDSFNLTVTNQDNASVVALNKTQVMLSPSATEKVSLNVGNATIGTFRVNVTATSQGDDSSKSDFVNITTTVEEIHYGVNLTVDNETKTTDVGENATYILTVTNTGNADDSFNLTVTNQDNANVVYLNKTQVTLTPSATETVSLNVGNAMVGTFRVNVTATSQGDDSSKSDFVNTTTTVVPVAVYGVDLTVDEEAKTTVEGENATYILTVNNTGNVADSFNLTFTNPDNASVVVLNKTQVTLSASATETVSLNVGNATVGTFRVNVTATSQSDDTSKSDSINTITTVATYGVNLTVDEEAKTTVKGENATYILTVNNTGSVVDTFNLTFTNPDNASVVVLNKTQVTLSASATALVSLNVGNATIGTCRVNVTATSLNDSNKADYVSTTTTVATYGVNLTVDAEAKTTDEGENATYILTVNNTGSVVDTFNITYTNPDNASMVKLNRTQVTLNASETGHVSLNVTNATGGLGTFRLNITATSQGDSDKTDCVYTTTTVAAYGVNLTVDKDAKPTVVGVNATYILTVKNTGNVADSFNLSYTNQDNASVVDLNRTQITLNASDTGIVALSVTDETVGTFRVNVTATLLNDSNKADRINTTTTVASLTVPPDSVEVGKPVTIKGAGFGANEPVTLSCSVSKFAINISDGEYEHSLRNFNLSDSNTNFSLSVREVKDNMTVNITTPLGRKQPINNYSSNKYGLVFKYDYANKTATVYSTGSLPVGIYDIEVSGTAADNATEVYINIMVTNIVTTRATGSFETVIDTHGLPPIDYTIRATSATASAEATLKLIPATAGSIAITSSPSGANAHLNNAYKGITPLTISDVDPGTHTIKLTLEDYLDWSQNVTVTAGETYDVHATLTKPTPTPTPGGRGGGGGGGSGPNDIDGDGYCNIDEIIMGSDPEDPCDPDPDCVACLALGKPTLVVPAPTPRPTATVKYLQTPTPRPTPAPSATATPTPKPLFPVLGPDKPILLIVIIIAVLVLIGTLFFLHRKFKTVDTESQNNDKIVWR